MKSKQTAVEWLIEQLLKRHTGNLNYEYFKIFEQAKEIEKQQIIDCFDFDGLIDGEFWITNGEQYFREFFN